MKEKDGHITMLHGAGGTVMHDLVKNYMVKYFADAGTNNAEGPLEVIALLLWTAPTILFWQTSHQSHTY